jgi:two-component system nitrate/nitrite response regulator NarL
MGTTVLIVDDHAGFRSFARRLLEAGGFRVLEAADGSAALEAVASHGPNLVLLDIQMPGLNGFDVAKRLATRDTAPVVVLMSSRAAADYGDRIATAPVAGFVPKADLSSEAVTSFFTGDR